MAPTSPNHAPQVCPTFFLNVHSSTESRPSQQAHNEAQTIKDIEHAPVSDDPRAWSVARKVRPGRCSAAHLLTSSTLDTNIGDCVLSIVDCWPCNHYPES